ncbi:hypothetical protein BY458DRAFT_527153 [Sporodiniella umbellata]|nr:hypothetical protein BY458DRAFT_527153 [Sporodiniella umbellata]
MHKPQGWEFFLDLESRTRRLVNLCAQLCMLNAGSEDLSHYLENQLGTLLKETTAEPNQLYCPLQEELAVSTKESPKHGSLIDSFKALPKVTIPQHTLHIKTYNQSLTGDIRRAIYEHRSQPEEGHWPTSTNESWSHPHAAWPVPKPPLASSAFSLNPTQNFYMDPFPQGNPLE